jgi:hypothetical protein
MTTLCRIEKRVSLEIQWDLFRSCCGLWILVERKNRFIPPRMIAGSSRINNESEASRIPR